MDTYQYQAWENLALYYEQPDLILSWFPHIRLILSIVSNEKVKAEGGKKEREVLKYLVCQAQTLTFTHKCMQVI